MVYLLYDFVLLASSLVLVPYYFLRGLKHGKMRRGVRERLGFYLPGRIAQVEGKEIIWVHAVSVGETRAAIPLLKALRRDHPEAALVLSNITETGRAVAEGIDEIDLAIFFPFDLSWGVKRVLRQVRPKIVIIVETEIWPNFVRIAHEMDIPVVLANGRISDRSFPRYMRGRFVIAPILDKFAAFCMQGEQDADRIQRMGALPERVEVTGNVKFDLQVTPPDTREVQSLYSIYRLSPGMQIWVAGSTHPGEEEAIADAYRRLCDSGRNLVLILVPRHPERCRGVAQMLTGRGFAVQLRSGIEGRRDELRPGEILLGDTLGEMLRFYAVADLVFVGGSLVPIGGHNALEASALQKPVIFGPFMHNFREIATLLLGVSAGVQISGPEELPGTLERLLDDPVRRQAMGEAGHALLRQNAGATRRTLDVARRVMGG
jgi:3-deoxy-D-manno-octulosonic-acid transferase